ncbi:MAG: serine/threonine-protein kinase [Candidatus Manganitrophus sp.]|nr:MAG: serine/threonine-protein kinase [Candidatus Manganitrophus sp.]
MSQPIRFGKYLLLDKIGTGGMAELFLAKQTGLSGFEKSVAIKRILPHLTQGSEFIAMFINEAKLAALLTHQNIVQIYDLGNVDQCHYIAMEYIMGKDLRTVINHGKSKNIPLSIGDALLIVSKICSALDYAHRKKDLNGNDLHLVHRDISPQNILISYEGEVKLVDFGIAKAAMGGQETKTGVLKGKLAYMSPEQAWGKPVDGRTDLFALGIVLYEAVTGERLFSGNDEISILEKVRKAEVPPPTQLNPAIPPELEAILKKAMAKEPEDRYQTASEMEMALEDLITKKGVRLQQSLPFSLYAGPLRRGDFKRYPAIPIAYQSGASDGPGGRSQHRRSSRTRGRNPGPRRSCGRRTKKHQPEQDRSSAAERTPIIAVGLGHPFLSLVVSLLIASLSLRYQLCRPATIEISFPGGIEGQDRGLPGRDRIALFSGSLQGGNFSTG